MDVKANHRGVAIDGAKNLLERCVEVSPGQTMLLVIEDASIEYFDAATPELIASQARSMGVTVLTMSTPRVSGPDAVPGALMAAMQDVDHTVFLNRIGDQMRFRSLPGEGTKTMVYSLDIEALGSRAAAIPYDCMTRMIGLINHTIDQATRYEVTCPAGTKVGGEMAKQEPVTDDLGGFAVRLFPMSVFKALPADTMVGAMVLNRWVTATNTHAYSPEVHYLNSPLTVQIDNGHSVEVSGDPAEVAAFKAHGAMVARQFGLDETQIHSWHGGVNPGTGYFAEAKADPVRWNGMIFGSPRYVHFHTCGDYPPGEISWHILDPTVSFDGEVLIHDGEVVFFDRPDAQALLAEYGLTSADMVTNQDIGL